MFLCSLVGIVVISLMVVAVTNKLEMTNLQSKAFTVITRVNTKDKVKIKAASLIGKACKIHLKIKRDQNIRVLDLFRLNKTIIEFKNLRK